jgi:protein-S-isoprenylcysteine O-methyltransferase Ste14
MNVAVEDHPRIVAFPPLLWLIGAVVSVLVHYFVFSIRILPEPLAMILGIVCLLVGPSLALPALFTMRAAGTHANPAKPALLIVRGGPYRFTRNPMYLALCLVQAGIGFLLNDWITLLFVVPLALILHFGVILPEERYLEAKFGEQYLALKREVRRWI